MYDKRGRESIYCSQKSDFLAPNDAPKPLFLVPESAVSAGFYHAPGIRLNKLTRKHGSPTEKNNKKKTKEKKNRRREKLGPSKLRYQVLV